MKYVKQNVPDQVKMLKDMHYQRYVVVNDYTELLI